MATIYGNMGNIYGDQRNYKEAVNNFNNSLEIFQNQGNKQTRVVAWSFCRDKELK